MTSWPESGGRGTWPWWNARSARSPAPAARPAPPTRGAGCRCTTTPCFGSFLTGSRRQADAGKGEHAVEPILVNPDEQKEALLVSAAGRLAGLLGDDIPDVGNPLDYLHAYYRHFAPDDLTAIGPERAAAVAAEHARL